MAPSPNTVSPVRKRRRWPKMSPSFPPTISRDAYVSEYAVNVHWSSESVALNSSWMVGSVTPSAVVGSDVMPLATVAATRVARRPRTPTTFHNLRPCPPTARSSPD